MRPPLLALALALLGGAVFFLLLFLGYRPTPADGQLAALVFIVLLALAALYTALKSRK